MKTKIMSAVRIAVSALLILLLLYFMRDKYDQIFAVLKGTNIPILALGILIYLVAIIIASYRLTLIVRAQDIPIRFVEAVSLAYIGYFFNNFLPTAIGGDVPKAYYLSRRSKEKTPAFMAIFVDRAIGLLTMMFMAFVALLFVNSMVVDKNVRYMIYAITAISALGIFFMLNKNFAKKFSILLNLVRPIKVKLVKAYDTIHAYKHHTALMVKSLIISIVSQIIFFVGVAVIALSVGVRIPPLELLLRMPIISAMSMLPSINGLGLREGATVLLFGPLVGKSSAFAISILWLFTLFFVSFVGGCVYLLSPHFKIKLKDMEDETA